MSTRQPPPGYLSTREAAERLGVSLQAVRDMLKADPPKLNGTPRGEVGEGLEPVRYWVEDDALLVREIERQRQKRRHQLANVDNVSRELSVSRDLALERFAELLSEALERDAGRLIEALQDVTRTVGRHGEELTERVTEMYERQTDTAADIKQAVRFLYEEGERRRQQMERDDAFQNKMLELRREEARSGEGQGVPPAGRRLWYLAWAILLVCVVGVTLLAFIAYEVLL